MLFVGPEASLLTHMLWHFWALMLTWVAWVWVRQIMFQHYLLQALSVSIN